MTVGRESIPVDQRAVFWKVEDPRSRITWLSNLCQDHATYWNDSQYLGLRCNTSDFYPAESKVEQACRSQVSEMKPKV